MATIKSFTDLEQSKKLADILPLESADMVYMPIMDIDSMSNSGFFDIPECYPLIEFKGSSIKPLPCWSLAALLEQLHYEVCDDDGYSTYLQINKDDDMYQLEYIDPSEIFESIETDRYEHFVDACVAMIERLHKLNLL